MACDALSQRQARQRRNACPAAWWKTGGRACTGRRITGSMPSERLPDHLELSGWLLASMTVSAARFAEVRELMLGVFPPATVSNCASKRAGKPPAVGTGAGGRALAGGGVHDRGTGRWLMRDSLVPEVRHSRNARTGVRLVLWPVAVGQRRTRSPTSPRAWRCQLSSPQSQRAGPGPGPAGGNWSAPAPLSSTGRCWHWRSACAWRPARLGPTTSGAEANEAAIALARKWGPPASRRATDRQHRQQQLADVPWAP